MHGCLTLAAMIAAMLHAAWLSQLLSLPKAPPRIATPLSLSGHMLFTVNC